MTPQEIVELDIALHGKRFILIEVILCSILFSALAIIELGVSILLPQRTSLLIVVSGIVLLSFAFNSLALLVLALRSLKQPHLPSAEDYTKEQIRSATALMARLVIVPLALPMMVFGRKNSSRL